MENNKDQKFWPSEPVETPNIDNKPEVGRVPENIPSTSIKLPENLNWATIDLTNDIELQRLHRFLMENYIEDANNNFAFEYDDKFLIWALMPPGYLKDWHVPVEDDKGKIIAFVSAIPSSYSLNNNVVKAVTINFLCIHKDNRNKYLSPILIKEITRRVNLSGIFQAVYTTGKVIHKPLTSASYFHRVLNFSTLVKARFLKCPDQNEASKLEKYYELPNRVEDSKLAIMDEKYLNDVKNLFRKKNKELTFHHQFIEDDDFKHWVLPREDFYYSYVVIENGTVEGFISYYVINTNVKDSEVKRLKGAFLMYLLSGEIAETEIVLEALIDAKAKGFDVFNFLNNSGSHDFIRTLKFGPGDGKLNYYIYNQKYESIDCSQARFEIF